jgi:hypothetical protein
MVSSRQRQPSKRPIKPSRSAPAHSPTGTLATNTPTPPHSHPQHTSYFHPTATGPLLVSLAVPPSPLPLPPPLRLLLLRSGGHPGPPAYTPIPSPIAPQRRGQVRQQRKGGAWRRPYSGSTRRGSGSMRRDGLLL